MKKTIHVLNGDWDQTGPCVLTSILFWSSLSETDTWSPIGVRWWRGVKVTGGGCGCGSQVLSDGRSVFRWWEENITTIKCHWQHKVTEDRTCDLIPSSLYPDRTLGVVRERESESLCRVSSWVNRINNNGWESREYYERLTCLSKC